MKLIIFACIIAAAASAKLSYGQQPRSFDIIEILRDDRQQTPQAYSFDFASADGIQRSESGDQLTYVENQPIGSQGEYSFTFPTGEKFDMKFVADENGFQPESAWLPVPPAFPHPIPQFVLDQIEKARREDEAAALSPRQGYYNSDEK